MQMDNGESVVVCFNLFSTYKPIPEFTDAEPKNETNKKKIQNAYANGIANKNIDK